MKLSKTSKYTLRILSFLASNKGAMYSAKELYDKLEVPEKYLRRLLTKLSDYGFVKSSYGRNGGYSLVKAPGQVSLYNIIDAIDGFASINECMLGYEHCVLHDKCAMHDIWLQTRESMLSTLTDTTLADLVSKEKNNQLN